MSKAKEATRLIVDAHLDLAYNAVMLKRDLQQPLDDLRSYERKHPPADPQAGKAMVTWPALVRGRVAVVGGSIFVEPWLKSHPQVVQTYRTPEQAHDQGVEQLDYYRRLSDEDDALRLLETTSDLDDVLASWETDEPTVGIFVMMEGADPISEPGELGWWVERGVRGIGLSWAAGTRYAGGNDNPGDLSDEGESLMYAMADYNLLFDISHLWEDAAFRALDHYPGPIVATHANPRRLVDTPRQLSDDMIRRITEREGVVGVVAFNGMLERGWRLNGPRMPLTRMVEAIDHICQLSGTAEAAGLGSDLDGGFGQASTPTGLDSVADLSKISDLLIERGYSPGDVDAILHGNWLRLMRQTLSAM